MLTATLAVAPVILVALALMVAEPGATPVTGTGAVIVSWGMVTVAGTVATAALLEERFTTWPPAGAGPESVTVRFADEPVGTGRFGGVKVNPAVTCTVALADVYPGAEAPMMVEPEER